MPDALSKSIPIWCAVINRLLFEHILESHSVHTPNEMVGASEHAQIEARIDGFVAEAKVNPAHSCQVKVCADLQSLGLDVPALRFALKKPLRPSWITPDSTFPEQIPSSIKYHRVICCTASHRVEGAEISENGYIQGAGDDSEGWSYGLTPFLFWKHKSQLLGAVEENMADMIHQMVHIDKSPVTGRGKAVKIGSTNLYIGALPDATQVDYDGVVICSGIPPQCSNLGVQGPEQKNILHFLCSDGKLGSRALRIHFPRLLPFVASMPSHAESPKILFACSTGRDLSVGVALTVLSTLFDDDCKARSNFSFQALSGQISA